METQMSPVTRTSIEQKIRSKQLAHMRFDTTKLRDLLRQKCRIRLRESRVGSFDQHRGPFSLAESDRSMLGSALQEEMRDLALQDEILSEMSEEGLGAFLNDLVEKEMQYFQQLGDQNDGAESDTASTDMPFFCPICQTNVLQPVFDHFVCESCSLRFKATGGSDLQYNLLRKIVEHENRPPSGCPETVSFFAEPTAGSEFSSLNMFCDACDYYATFRPSD